MVPMRSFSSALRTEYISSPMGMVFFCAEALPARRRGRRSRGSGGGMGFPWRFVNRNIITAGYSLVASASQFPDIYCFRRLWRRLRTVPNLVIEAAPGAGKTTRVPPALLASGARCWCWSPGGLRRGWRHGGWRRRWASGRARPSGIRCGLKKWRVRAHGCGS